MNDTLFSNLVYYNFFHYLNRLLLIIMEFLTSSNSKYSSFQKYQTELAKIITHSDKSLYVIDIKKNKSTQQFKPNTLNSKKLRKNEVKQLRSELIDEIKTIVDSNNNQNNSNLNNKIKKLVEKIIKEKQIKFEFLKDNDEIKRRIRKFLELLKTSLHVEIERTNYNLSNLNKKKTVKDKFNFFKEEIFKEVYRKLVEKLNKLNKTSKKFEETIIEFLYIFIICFSDIFHTLENIRSNRSELKQLGQKINTMLDKFKKNNTKELRRRLYINGVKKHLELLEGTSAKPEQIAKSLEEKSVELMKNHKLTKENLQNMKRLKLLPAVLSVKRLENSPVGNNNSESSPKNTVVLHSSKSKYNSLTAQNKKEVVNKLQKLIKKGNEALKKKKIQEIANQININKPNHIKTIDDFEKEIKLRFKPKQYLVSDGEETKLIQELSKEYQNKNTTLTNAQLKQYLDKITPIISAIKKNKSLKIKSFEEFKNLVLDSLVK